MEPGDRIGLFLPASRSYVVSWFASLSAGLVDVPISTELSGRLLQYALERGEVSVIVTDREGLATIATLPDEVRTQLRLAIIANGKAPDSALEPIRVVDLETAASRGGDQALPACDATGLASLRYTSGSTGPPKAIMVRQAHML